MPPEESQKNSKCLQNCDCKKEFKKCQDDKTKCDCNQRNEMIKKCKSADAKSRNVKDKKNEENEEGKVTKKCNCQCQQHSNTRQAAFAEVSDDPGVLAVAPLSPQSAGQSGMRRGRGSKKCCCCDCCHDCCCCHDC